MLGFLLARVGGAMLAQDRHHYSEPKCQAQSSDELDPLGRWIWTDHAQAFWSPWIKSMCRTTDGAVRINVDIPPWQAPGHDPRGAVVCEQVAGYLAQLVGRERYPGVVLWDSTVGFRVAERLNVSDDCS
jgi:hypothetical protein